jgi:uncharacterized protein
MPTRNQPENLETRTYVANVAFEKRGDTATTDNRMLEGHAAVFNELTNLYDFREQIAPNAFANALSEGQDVVANINHDDSMLLGRTSSGTVQLEENEHGLNSRIDLPTTTLGNDTKILVERGDISKMSFRFAVREEGEQWEFPETGTPIRTLTDLDLYDVSLVTFPAYEGTDIAVAQRSLDNAKTGAPKMKEELDKKVVSADGSSTNVTLNLNLDSRFVPAAVAVVEEDEEEKAEDAVTEEPEEEPTEEEEKADDAEAQEDPEDGEDAKPVSEVNAAESDDEMPEPEEDESEEKAGENPFEEDPEKDEEAETKAEDDESEEEPEEDESEDENPFARAKGILDRRLENMAMKLRQSSIQKIKSRNNLR